MRRRTAVRGAALLALAVAVSVAILATRGEEGPGFREAPPLPPDPPRPTLSEALGGAAAVDEGPRPWETEEESPEEPGAPGRRGRPPPPDPTWWDRQSEALKDESWKAYPGGARGPVVVGVLVKAGETDVAAWVALEDLRDPEREDPSRVESLNWGRFRLTGFEPGRYRVRARTDDGFAVYSAPLEVGDGEVGDAGVLRLQLPGSVSGVVYGPEGDYAEAVVRLFGRNPATMERTVVETKRSHRREGFVLAPHEAGPFSLAVVAREGYAVHRGSTDSGGLAWAVVRLEPWASLAVALAPAGPGEPEGRLLRATLTPLEVPDLGLPPAVRTLTGPGTFATLAAGRYRLVADWSEGDGAGAVERTWTGEVLVPTPEGTIEVPRRGL